MLVFKLKPKIFIDLMFQLLSSLNKAHIHNVQSSYVTPCYSLLTTHPRQISAFLG